MRFASLGSGSRGNSLVVESGRTRILIDAGFGPREISRRLGRLGLVPNDIDGVLVTHEHSDHVGGVLPCAGRFDWPVFLTAGTLAGAKFSKSDLPVTVFDSHHAFAIGDLRVEPFPVPHDAREPVQFVLEDRSGRLGVITDAGHVTAHMKAMLANCAALVLECNHDLGMLEHGPYPMHLKRRVGGPLGHLDNLAAATLLEHVDTRKLLHVVAAHLSEHNNTPDLACDALGRALGCSSSWIGVATQDTGFAWRQI